MFSPKKMWGGGCVNELVWGNPFTILKKKKVFNFTAFSSNYWNNTITSKTDKWVRGWRCLCWLFLSALDCQIPEGSASMLPPNHGHLVLGMLTFKEELTLGKWASFPCLCRSTFLHITYKENHHVAFCIWPLSTSIMFSRFVHVLAFISTCFFFFMMK